MPNHGDAPMDRRRAGVLLHPTSLPSGIGGGDLGADAYRFVDLLAVSGFSVWQMLPLSPTHGDLSPYNALSVHAGNPLLISLEPLIAQGWLQQDSPDDGVSDPAAWRIAALGRAYCGFVASASTEQSQALQQFAVEQAHWLDDYALFQTLRKAQSGRHWLNWPAALRDREAQALVDASQTMSEQVEQIRFEQFLFFQQWHALKQYANQKGVLLFGDMPIFVAHDSAEVWAHRELFTLDEHGEAQVVAGVPPDYFSETGQRWGNPHYRWERMEADGFAWWKQRMATQLGLFDWVRIDHFRGFEAYWEIPASAETAIDGRWVKAPGEALFSALQEAFDPLPLVAEDLGIITPEVDALRHQFALPGMKILQFAFDGGCDNPYLPHNYECDSVVYTGTHDNDTTLGWFDALSAEQQAVVREYIGFDDEMPWSLLRCALASTAQVAIIPMQDLLSLGSEGRMNIPGTVEGNWRWHFQWQQVDDALAPRLQELVQLYGRKV